MATSGTKGRAAGYVRVSDASQVDGYSLDAQRTEIERWCERNGYEVVTWYNDEGTSAHTEHVQKRPVFNRMLLEAKGRAWEIVVVHTIDRFSRNVGVQKQALSQLGEVNIGFASVMENIDFTTAPGRLLLTTLGGVAEFLSDQIGVHVSKAFRHKAEIGLQVGPVPFGFRMGEGAVPVIDPEEGRLVREMFERRAGGASYGDIARWLNDLGQRTRDGNLFTAHAVRDVLNNRFYAGAVRYKGAEYPGKHQAIIPERLFGVVQSRRGGARVRTVFGGSGLLQGRNYCVRCGKSLQADRGRNGVPMYRERHSGDCLTNEKSAMAHPFDQEIGSILRAVALPPGWREQMAALAAAKGHGPDLQDLDRQLKRLSRVYVEGDMPDAEYQQRREELQRRKREAAASAPPDLTEAAELFENMTSLWEEATPEERRRLLGCFVERTYIDLASGEVCALVPAAGFQNLLQQTLVTRKDSNVTLLSCGQLGTEECWSWWRRGGVEPPVQKGLRSISHKLLR